jgi:hypothetical protein
MPGAKGRLRCHAPNTMSAASATAPTSHSKGNASLMRAEPVSSGPGA